MERSSLLSTIDLGLLLCNQLRMFPKMGYFRFYKIEKCAENFIILLFRNIEDQFGPVGGWPYYPIVGLLLGGH